MSARTIMFCDLCETQMSAGGRAFIKSARQSTAGAYQMGFQHIDVEHVHVCKDCMDRPISTLVKLLP